MTAETTSRAELAGVLVQLRRRVDDHFAAAVARTPAAFACQAGCDRCCHQRFGVFEVEAAPLRQALAALAMADPPRRQRIRAQADDPGHADRCPLLVDGRCSVYAHRPLICRSHGLPIAIDDGDPDGGPPRVDHCPLNFTGGAPPPAPSVLRLSAVNRPLVVLAALWQQAERSADGGPERSADAGPKASADAGRRVDLAALARA